MKTLAGALVLGFTAIASAAHAGTTLVGGGATLPALGYGGDVTHRQITPVTGSFLYVYSAQAGNPQTSYCQTGSGAGKNILAGVSGTSVQNACPDGSATPTGFGAAAVGRSDLTQPNFAGADSPLSASDYSNYVTNRSSSFPVEFPAVAGAVAIAFDKSGVDTLNLTDAQVCQIFSGQVTDWSQISSASGPINVVFRSDGSGTTFGFSNHLSAVCGGTAASHFVTDQAFTNVVAKYQSTLPSNWVGQSGNPNVANYVANNDGTIAYVEAANAANDGLLYATVNNLDPINDFGNAALPISSSSVNYNYVISGANATTGRPTMAAISGAPSTQCIALVDPSAYANPSSGYPIVAVSYLLANSANNGSDKTAVQNLMWAPYNSTITGSVKTIGKATGLSFLSTSFTQTQVQGCVGA
ncbi:substrate-binding domain-containing protein [Dyella sp. AD56]|uniref:substrate-binding domain-containing protein n=1 Tax=Dyella sp. AD56 TaxID=1528744 RepID=UPI001304029D|nr:substrate-binding domain-containing protein [Dyella sp. AD56]